MDISHSEYIERIYSGLVGKMAGIISGAPIEGWSAEQIAREIGFPNGYPHRFEQFASDDDINGPLFFIRAAEDYGLGATAEQMGKTWLNYIPCEHGFLWWGGYGVSTEHTAYLNLRAGIPAPRSGSAALNGKTVGDQIGGQIFIDSWGLISPGDPALAAKYAAKAASVSHDGEGIVGGMFVAACVAAAFTAGSPREAIDAALAVVPQDSLYARVVRDVVSKYESLRDWRGCFEHIKANYGYDRYGGGCHIIPNAAVVALALIASGGSFTSALNISNACGWDTDCNSGNVGAIMGVLCGIGGIDSFWRDGVRDIALTSSALGDQNMTDLPSFAERIAAIASGEPLRGGINFDFALPGSVHGFKITSGSVENVGHALLIKAENDAKLLHRTYYFPEDMDDDRYNPCFSPKVWPGQRAAFTLSAAEPTAVRLYARDGHKKTDIVSPSIELTPEAREYSLELPVGDALISEIGLMLPAGAEVRLTHVGVAGEASYRIDFTDCPERRTGGLFVPEQLAPWRQLWRTNEGVLTGSCADESEVYTGGAGWTDLSVSARLTPAEGQWHALLFRVQGAARSYALALSERGLELCKKDVVRRTLTSRPFAWRAGEEYELRVAAVGERITAYVNGEKVLSYTDNGGYTRGEVGFAVRNGSRMLVRELRVEQAE